MASCKTSSSEVEAWLTKVGQGPSNVAWECTRVDGNREICSEGLVPVNNAYSSSIPPLNFLST